jgi:Ca2+-binding RTX toxin-like protein
LSPRFYSFALFPEKHPKFRIASNLVSSTGGLAAGNKMEPIMGNLFIDRHTSTSQVDEWGHEGDDTILGGSAGDKLKGAQGNDVIHGNGGNDVIMDTTWVGLAPDFGNLFSYTRTGSYDRDQLSNFNIESLEVSSTGPVTFLFHGGNDQFFGDDGDDYIFGFEGNDVLDGGNGLDVILGGSGDDSIIGGDGDDILSGNSGNDNIVGGAGDDLINGGSGDDRMEGGEGGDQFDGGSGNDTIAYDNSAEGVEINLGTGLSSLFSSSHSDARNDSFTDVENADGSHFNDALFGNSVANKLFGNLGNDTLGGGGGGDTLDGGAGSDTADYEGSDAAVNVTLDDAALHLASVAGGGDAAGDTLISIENLTGSDHNDTLTGSSAANRIIGGSGNDVISGLSGIDVLFGGTGADTLLGGDQNDTLDGGDGADTIDGGSGVNTALFSDNSRAVNVTLGNAGIDGHAVSFLMSGRLIFPETDILRNIQNVAGSSYNDQITGNDADNTIHGGLGDDLLHFSGGHDALYGDSGTDTLDLTGAHSGAVITLATSLTFAGNTDSASLNSIENVNGTAFDDTIVGTGADNRIYGAGGHDLMTGGLGSDTFIFRAISELGLDATKRDIITDFSVGDHLDFSAFDADPAVSGDQAFTFLGSGAFTHHAGEIRVVPTNHHLDTLVALDVDGDGVADGRIELTGTHQLSSDDFIL